MSDPVTFSIVTPSYNQGHFLAETIESVLSQAGDFAIDYLVVDGGSTDDSLEVIRRFKERLEKGQWETRCRAISYRYLSEKDDGQTDAILKGFALAKGEIFAWLNADDTYLPGALESAAARFRAKPETALLYGDAHYCDSAGAVIGRYRTQPFDYQRLAWFNFICQPASFFRKEAFEAAGGLDRALHFAMDYDLWIRLGSRFSCSYLPRFLATYRLHESSKTVSSATLYQNSEEALQLALKYFGWAPLTRVYNSCNFLCASRLPGFLARRKVALLVATLACSVLRSLWLNRGIRAGDLALLRDRENFGKLFKSRLQIMTGKR